MGETLVERLRTEVVADVTNYTRNMKKAEDSLDSFKDAIKKAATSIVGGIGLVGLAKQAISSAAEMDSLKRGLEAVTGSAAKAEDQFRALAEVAKLPGLGLKEAIEGSTRLQAAGLSADMARRSLMGFGNALATVGKGKADLQGVILALTQMSAKGKIVAQDLNQIAERVPQIRQVMLKAFGTADTEILQKRGVDATEFLNKIVTELEKLPMVTSGLKNSLENMSDATFKAFAEMGKAVQPFVETFLDNFLTPAISGITDFAVQIGGLGTPLQATGTILISTALGGTRALQALSTAFATTKTVALAMGTGLTDALIGAETKMFSLIKTAALVGAAIAGIKLVAALQDLEEANRGLDKSSKDARSAAERFFQFLQTTTPDIAKRARELRHAFMLGQLGDTEGEGLNNFVRRMRDLSFEWDAFIKRTDGGKRNLEGLSAAFKEAFKRANIESVQDQTETIKNLENAYKAAKTAFDAHAEGVTREDVNQAYIKLRKAKEGLKDATEKLADEEAAEDKKARELAKERVEWVGKAFDELKQKGLVYAGDSYDDFEDLWSGSMRLVSDYGSQVKAVMDATHKQIVDATSKTKINLLQQWADLTGAAQRFFSDATGITTPARTLDVKKDASGGVKRLALDPNSTMNLQQAFQKARMEERETLELWQKKLASQQDYERAVKRTKEAEEKLKGEHKAQHKAFSEMTQEVQKAFRHMARGIAEAVVEWKSLRETGIEVIKSLAKGILEILINGALKKLAGVLGSIFLKQGGILGKLGGVLISGAGGAVASKVATDAATQAAATAAANAAVKGATGGAGAAAGAATSGLMGTIGAVGSAVSAISGIISNFQLHSLGKDMGRVEQSSRFTSIDIHEVRDVIANKLVPLTGYIWQGVLAFWKDGIRLHPLTLDPLLSAIKSGRTEGSGNSGNTVVIQVTPAQADEIIDKLKQLGVPLPA